MRSSGGGEPITVPARRLRRLWIIFWVIVAVMLIEAALLGLTFYRLNRAETLLRAKQTEAKELYINLARQNEQLISLKKLVPSGSATYLASQPQPAVVSALPPATPAPAATAAAVPAGAAAPAAMASAPQLGPAKAPAAMPPVAKPVAVAPPLKPAGQPVVAVQPAPPTTELVKLLDLKMAGGQVSLRLKRASGELASGYLVAVFAGGGNLASYPTVDLKRGEPLQGRQGLDFNVRNYRLISFDSPGSSWSRLTFYVYDSRGRLKQRQAFSKEQLKK